MHATGSRHRAAKDPIRQRRIAQGLAGVDVLFHHVGHSEPTGFLPELERTLLHAKAPAHAQVHITRVVGNGAQMHGGIVKGVAQNRPQELPLRALAVAQQLQAFGRGLFQHAAVDLVSLLATRHIGFGRQIKAQDVTPGLLEKAGLGLLPQVAHLEQGFQHLGGGKAGVERISLQTQGVLQCLDDMGHGVEPHHVGGAESARAGAAELFAGQVVDHVITQAVVLHFFHGGQHAGHTDAIGNEVGRVLGAHHALAQTAGDKGFEVVEDVGLGGGGVDQLHQQHVARRVEEVDAAKTRFDFLGQHLAQLRDGKPRGVGRDDGVRRHEGRNFLVQVEFPVHAFGNGFDHQVATLEQFQVLFVVGLLDQRGIFNHAQR